MVLLLVLLIVLTIGYFELAKFVLVGAVGELIEDSGSFRLTAKVSSVAPLRVVADRLIDQPDGYDNQSTKIK